MQDVILTDEIVKAIMIFMERVDLKGSEVPAFTTCMQALRNEFSQGYDPNAPSPPESPDG